MNKKLIYENPLSCHDDIENFILEGDASIYFVNDKMRMENKKSPDEGQSSNFVFWCDKTFPENIEITFSFKPIREPGLAMLFFSATGANGENLFSTQLLDRTGIYSQYCDSDISTYHVSYFRRKNQRAFNMCNLRKSPNFNLVCTGSDPIPSVRNIKRSYQITLKKLNNSISFYIDDLLLFKWEDDGKTYGPILKEGCIGFRQMAPLIAEYSDLKIFEIK